MDGGRRRTGTTYRRDLARSTPRRLPEPMFAPEERPPLSARRRTPASSRMSADGRYPRLADRDIRPETGNRYAVAPGGLGSSLPQRIAMAYIRCRERCRSQASEATPGADRWPGAGSTTRRTAGSHPGRCNATGKHRIRTENKRRPAPVPAPRESVPVGGQESPTSRQHRSRAQSLEPPVWLLLICCSSHAVSFAGYS